MNQFLGHYREVCQYGETHGQCRCPSLSKATRRIACPNDEHKPPPQQEDAWPTPAQWMQMYLSRPPDKQLEMAERVVQNAEFAAMCTEQDHVGQIVLLRGRVTDLVNIGVRLHTAWGSARHRAKQYRFLIDAVNRSPHHAHDDIPPSQSDPEALPPSDEKLIDDRTRDRMPEEEMKR